MIDGSHVFLPLFEAQGEGHINATASQAGLYGPPFLAAYNTSKFGVVGLMQHLARDLRAANASVGAWVFCPGAVRPNLPERSQKRRKAAIRSVELAVETMRFGAFATELASTVMDPAKADSYFLDGIDPGKFRIFSHEHVPKNAPKHAELMSLEGKSTDL